MVIEDKIYQIKVGLLETKPIVWRRFLVPANITFYRLHLVLQNVMGWKNRHLYLFQYGNNQYGEPDPDVEFNDTQLINSRKTRLSDVITREKSIFLYEYDFGDRWEHELFVERIIPRDPNMKYPICIDGENACPPEDSGGPYGYAEKLEILQNPGHEEHRIIKKWMGRNFDSSKFDIDSVNRKLAKMKL